MNAFLIYATRDRAEEIHFALRERGTEILFRINGEWHRQMSTSRPIHAALMQALQARCALSSTDDVVMVRYTHLPRDWRQWRVRFEAGEFGTDARLEVLPWRAEDAG